MNATNIAWALGRRYMGWPALAATRGRAYGRERVPKTGFAPGMHRRYAG